MSVFHRNELVKYRHRAPQRSMVGSFASTLGIVAVAFGIGVLGAYALDLHAHTCDVCGHKWRHLGALNLGDSEAHRCARCGTLQWMKCGPWKQAATSPRPGGMTPQDAAFMNAIGVPLGGEPIAQALPPTAMPMMAALPQKVGV